MNIFEILKKTKLPVAYSKFDSVQPLPFIVYMGAGQDVFAADNTYYHTQNKYRIEYYYKTKDEAQERALEAILLAHGLKYSKSDDTYIEDEKTYVIYYEV